MFGKPPKTQFSVTFKNRINLLWNPTISRPPPLSTVTRAIIALYMSANGSQRITSYWNTSFLWLNEWRAVKLTWLSCNIISHVTPGQWVGSGSLVGPPLFAQHYRQTDCCIGWQTCLNGWVLCIVNVDWIMNINLFILECPRMIYLLTWLASLGAPSPSHLWLLSEGRLLFLPRLMQWKTSSHCISCQIFIFRNLSMKN